MIRNECWYNYNINIAVDIVFSHCAPMFWLMLITDIQCLGLNERLRLVTLIMINGILSINKDTYLDIGQYVDIWKNGETHFQTKP